MYDIPDRTLLDIRKAAGPRGDYIMRLISGCRVKEEKPRKPRKVKES